MGQQLPDEGTSLAQAAALLIPAPCRAEQPGAALRLVVIEEPAGGDPEVVGLAIQHAHARVARGPKDAFAGRRPDRGHHGRMPSLERVSFASLREPLERVLAEERVHPEADLVRALVAR